MARDIIYWDSAAFLGVLNNEPGKFQKAEDVWVAAGKGLYMIATSTFTSAEVIYMKGVPKLDPSNRQKVNNFFRDARIAQRPVTRMIAELARDIVWDTSVKPKDAIHVATAAYHKIKTLHTFDDGLLKLGKLNVAGFTVHIQEPYAPRQLTIEDGP